MTKQPFFSIITPVYNREDIVTQTILSVLNQSWSDFEYILINDASQDNSIAVLNAFAQQDSRIRVIDLEDNEGRCFARNQGLNAAKGEWICYLDSDDLYYEDHLSALRESITHQPDFLAFAMDQHINGELKNYRRKSLHADSIVLTIEDFIEDNPLTANQLCHSSSLNVHWSNERIPISEDWLFLRNLVLRHPIFKRNKVTNNLIDHANRSMNTTDSKAFVNYNLMAAKKFIDENELAAKLSKRIHIYTHLLCVNVLLNDHQKKDAWKLFKPCFGSIKSFSYSLFYKALVKFLVK